MAREEIRDHGELSMSCLFETFPRRSGATVPVQQNDGGPLAGEKKIMIMDDSTSCLFFYSPLNKYSATKEMSALWL